MLAAAGGCACGAPIPLSASASAAHRDVRRKLLTGGAPLWGAQAARTFCTADHLAGQKDKDAVRCPAPPPRPDAKQSSNSTVRPRRAPGSGC